MSSTPSLERLYEFSNLYFSSPTPKFKRYLYKDIDFSSKMLGVLVQRSVGKTTLIRQLAQNYELQTSKITLESNAKILKNIIKENNISYKIYNKEIISNTKCVNIVDLTLKKFFSSISCDTTPCEQKFRIVNSNEL